MTEGVRLAPREFEALARYARSGSYKVVASEMGLSLQTVKNHLRHAAERFGVSGSVETFRAVGWLVVPEEETWPRP